MIVPVALEVPRVAFTGLESVTVNVSLASYTVSPTINTVKVALVEPAGIVTVPDFAMKSAGAVAVPGEVA